MGLDTAVRWRAECGQAAAHGEAVAAVDLALGGLSVEHIEMQEDYLRYQRKHATRVRLAT
jgi:hypothetical protein